MRIRFRFAAALSAVTELDKSLERYVALDPGVVHEVKHILHMVRSRSFPDRIR